MRLFACLTFLLVCFQKGLSCCASSCSLGNAGELDCLRRNPSAADCTSCIWTTADENNTSFHCIPETSKDGGTSIPIYALFIILGFVGALIIVCCYCVVFRRERPPTDQAAENRHNARPPWQNAKLSSGVRPDTFSSSAPDGISIEGAFVFATPEEAGGNPVSSEFGLLSSVRRTLQPTNQDAVDHNSIGSGLRRSETGQAHSEDARQQPVGHLELVPEESLTKELPGVGEGGPTRKAAAL